MSLRFTRSARADLSAIRDWYRAQSPRLDREFLVAIDEALDTIEQFPLSHPLVHRGARRALLRKFPYMLFYRPMGGDIFVVGCFHVAREPRVWRQRLDQ